MKHLRFVHNAQAILCLTVIYLVLSSWTSGPEVASDLDGFLRTTQLAKRVAEDPDNLALLVPAVHGAHAQRNREISQEIGHRVIAVAPSMVQSMTPLPADSAPIGVQWRELEKQEWSLKEIDTSQHDFTEIRRWYARWLVRWRGCMLYFRRDLRERQNSFGLRLSDDEIRRFMTPNLNLMVANWPGQADFVSATVEMRVHVPDSPRTVWCRPNAEVPAPRSIGRGEEWEPTVERQSFGSYRFPVQTQTVRLPSSTFERYPYLHEALPSIGDLTPAEVREWAANHRVSEVRGREPRLLGTSIRGEDLGVVAPFAISALHLYLLITLLSMFGHKRHQAPVDDVLPWLPTMKAALPIVFTVLTLALCPAVAAGIALWRLTTTSLFVLVVWSLALFVAGVGIGALASKLGDGSVAGA